MVDRLIEECNIEETSLVKINSAMCKSNYCILYYFVYYKYINHNKKHVSVCDYVYQRKNY